MHVRELTVAFLLLAGCRAQQLQRDQFEFRSRVQELYTDQVMNNLVRAHLGMPFVQLDYSDITGTVTQEASGSIGVDQTVKDLRDFSPVAAIAREVTDVLHVGVGGINRNQLTVTANPVINSNQVYYAYLRFLKRDNRILASPNPPPEGAAHIVKEYCGTYYWVPLEYRYEFLQLGLETSVLREKGTPVPVSKYYERKILKVVGVNTPIPNPRRQHQLTIKLDKKVPNDSGYMRGINVKGAAVTLHINFNTLVPLGDETDLLDVVYSQDEIDVTPPELQALVTDKSVQIELMYYQPQVALTDKVLKNIERNTRLFRLDEGSR